MYRAMHALQGPRTRLAGTCSLILDHGKRVGGVLFSDRGPRLEGKEDAIFPNITANRAPISPAKLQMDATSEERVRRVDQRDWSQQERGELDGSGGLRGQTL